MRGPWISRAVHAAEIEALRRQLATLAEDRDYWRARAERLIDATLGRAGAITAPVMGATPRPAPGANLANIYRGLAMTEVPKEGA